VVLNRSVGHRFGHLRSGIPHGVFYVSLIHDCVLLAFLDVAVFGRFISATERLVVAGVSWVSGLEDTVGRLLLDWRCLDWEVVRSSISHALRIERAPLFHALGEGLILVQDFAI
jgi:hypothetical protein